MSRLRLGTIEKLLLKLPNSERISEFSKTEDAVYVINHIVVVIPSSGTTINHLTEILQNQLEMSWWMIDYLYGQNGIK